MPTTEWLKKEFHYGYQSGDILATIPDEQRQKEESVIGGSYNAFFKQGVCPLLTDNSRVLELGPGAGTWTRALLSVVTKGEVHTSDFQDVRQWLHPASYNGRLFCTQVNDNSFREYTDDYFDLFFSFGVLVHCNQDLISDILHNALRKVKPGGYALHNFGDWKKLTAWGWDRGKIPTSFAHLPDDEIWWPRNTTVIMATIAKQAGWKVEKADLKYFQRDGVILLRRP